MAETLRQKAERLKLEAEAEKALADAERADAEAEKARAEARAARAEAAEAEIQLLRVKEERRNELAGDEYARVYRFGSSVSEQSVNACMAKLTRWSRVDPGCDIEIVFTSPGGSVFHGMALFDYIGVLSRQGHKMTATDLGYSASMAGILLQAADVRRMGRESYFHIHEISTGMIGKVSELEDEVEFCKKMTKRVVDIFVSRSNGKITERKLRRMFERKEAWFSSDEALKYGLVDEVL